MIEREKKRKYLQKNLMMEMECDRVGNLVAFMELLKNYAKKFFLVNLYLI